MNRLFWLIVGLLSYQTIYAQSSYDELLHLSYDYFTPSSIPGTSTKLSRQHINFSGAYGWDLNYQGDLLSVGLAYQGLELKTTLDEPQTLNIHNTSIGLGWLKNWKNLSWASSVSIGLAAVSDYQSSINSAFQNSFSANLHYGKSEELIWTFGVLYSDQPFGPWVFPVLGVDWNINDRLYFSTILFSHAYLEYAIKPKFWYAGVEVKEMGMSFVVSEFQNQPNSYITSFSEAFPYYPYAMTVFNDFYFAERFSLFVKMGTLISRANRHFSLQNEPLVNSVYNNPVKPSFYLQTGLALRFRNF
ncbi:MAG: DUF6268 family outer membrane beta-barrel protein [Bacteroidota bacterium]